MLKPKKKFKTTPKPATVEEAGSSDEQEHEEVGRGPVKATKSHALRTLPEFQKLLETTIFTLEELEVWIRQHEFEDNDTVSMVVEKCMTLSKLLRASKTPRAVAPTGMGIFQDFDQFFFYRNGCKLMVLPPLEVFNSSNAISRKKVVGFVRREGATNPLVYSISGFDGYLNPHPKLLDSQEWTNEVFRFGSFHGHQFRTNGWDRFHGKVDGAAAASHVEPKLMLFYACRLLGKLTGIQTIAEQGSRLYKLRDIRPSPNAEIFLSRAPCESCKRFQELVEDITAIKFTIRVCANVACVSLSRDRHGYKVLPMYAEDSDAEDTAHREELMSMLRKIERLEKENGKLNKQVKAMPIGSSEEFDSEDSVTEKVQKTAVQVVVPLRRLIEIGVPKTNRSPVAKVTTKTKMTMRQTHHRTKPSSLSGFTDVQKTPRKRANNSEDDLDYELPGHQSQGEASHVRCTTKRKSRRSGLLSPGESPRFENLGLDFEEVEHVLRRQESIKSIAKKLKFRH